MGNLEGIIGKAERIIDSGLIVGDPTMILNYSACVGDVMMDI